jgi:hypothetical protein
MLRHRGFHFQSRFASIESWCGRVDSNHHGIATASPSSWCVCQFRHDRAGRVRETIIGAFHSNVNICAASVCLHRFSSTGARPSSFWTLGKLLGSRLHSGANGGKLGSRCAKACDEIENLFEEDGAIEASP